MTYPGIYMRGLSPYRTAALEAARYIMEAPGYEPAVYRVPSPCVPTLPAGANFEGRLSLPVASYVFGFSGSSAETAGFRVQVVDLGTGSAFFNEFLTFDLVCPQGAEHGITYPVAVLPTPRLVIEPAVLAVRIQNLAALANAIQFAVWTAEPR